MSGETGYGGGLALPDETIEALRLAQEKGQTIHRMSPLATLALAEYQGQFTTTTREDPGSLPHYLRGRSVERILETNARRAAGRLLLRPEFGQRHPEDTITAADMLELFECIAEASLGITGVHLSNEHIVDRQIRRRGPLTYRNPWDPQAPDYRPPKRQNRAVMADARIVVQNRTDRAALVAIFQELLHRREPDRGILPMRVDPDREGFTVTNISDNTIREPGASVVSIGTTGLAGEQDQETEAGRRGVVMPALKLSVSNLQKLGTTLPETFITGLFGPINNHYTIVLQDNKTATDDRGRVVPVTHYSEVLAGDLGLFQAMRDAMAAACNLRGVRNVPNYYDDFDWEAFMRAYNNGDFADKLDKNHAENTEQEERLRLLRLSLVGDAILRRVKANRDYAVLTQLLNAGGRFPGPRSPRASNLVEKFGDQALKTDDSAWEKILGGTEVLLALTGIPDAALLVLRAAPGIGRFLLRVQNDKQTWEKRKDEAAADQEFTQRNVGELLARAGQA